FFFQAEDGIRDFHVTGVQTVLFRSRAARLCREFPVLLEHLAAGELHLTGLLLLGPHLTEENHGELLALAKHRTKREVLKLVRRKIGRASCRERVQVKGAVGELKNKD